MESSDTPSVTSQASQPTTIIPEVTNQATVMTTGTAALLPGSTISASAAPDTSAPSGFWTNKGAVAGTFTVVSLIGIVLLFVCHNHIARRRRHARYRREDEEAYYEKAAQQQSAPGDSGLEEAEASMTNIMTLASTDAYPDRRIHFGATTPQAGEVAYTPQNYGIDFPPETNYQANASNGQPSHFAPARPLAHPQFGNSTGLALPTVHDAASSEEYDPFYNTAAGGSYAI